MIAIIITICSIAAASPQAPLDCVDISAEADIPISWCATVGKTIAEELTFELNIDAAKRGDPAVTLRDLHCADVGQEL